MKIKHSINIENTEEELLMKTSIHELPHTYS
jgi:hypothetical protein